MQELAQPRPTSVFVRGDFSQPTEPVDPGAPAVLHPFPAGPKAIGWRSRSWLVDRR